MLTILLANRDSNAEILAPEIQIVLSLGASITLSLAAPEIPIQITLSSSKILKFESALSQLRYYLTITGSEDGVVDIDIPCSSFQSRRRSGEPTYLQAVIPSLDYNSYLNERPNGRMIIYQGYEQNGEVVQREKIVETTIDTINIYEGAKNQSIVLIGYKTETYTQKAITLFKPAYRAFVSGKIKYRLSEPDISLSPGDSVTIGTDTIIADVISYAVSTQTNIMEISEG